MAAREPPLGGRLQLALGNEPPRTFAEHLTHAVRCWLQTLPQLRQRCFFLRPCHDLFFLRHNLCQNIPHITISFVAASVALMHLTSCMNSRIFATSLTPFVSSPLEASTP